MSRSIGDLRPLVVVAVLGVLALAGATTGSVGVAEGTDIGTVAEGDIGTVADADNVSLGGEISSFMQASSVEAADDVEETRFEVALNRTDDPAERRALLEARQARLEARSEQLQTQRAGLGETPDVRNRSLATRIALGATGVERSVNATERAAASVGMDTDHFGAIRSNARSVRTPDVAGLAGDVANRQGTGPNGPPGSDGDSSDADERRHSSDSSADNRSGPPGVGDDESPGSSEPPGPVTDAGDANRTSAAGDSRTPGPPDSSDGGGGGSASADRTDSDTSGADDVRRPGGHGGVGLDQEGDQEAERQSGDGSDRQNDGETDRQNDRKTEGQNDHGPDRQNDRGLRDGFPWISETAANASDDRDE